VLPFKPYNGRNERKKPEPRSDNEKIEQTKAMIRFLESVDTKRARQDAGKYKTQIWKLEKEAEE
jgi:hypothetical protein